MLGRQRAHRPPPRAAARRRQLHRRRLPLGQGGKGGRVAGGGRGCRHGGGRHQRRARTRTGRPRRCHRRRHRRRHRDGRRRASQLGPGRRRRRAAPGARRHAAHPAQLCVGLWVQHRRPPARGGPLLPRLPDPPAAHVCRRGDGPLLRLGGVLLPAAPLLPIPQAAAALRRAARRGRVDARLGRGVEASEPRGRSTSRRARALNFTGFPSAARRPCFFLISGFYLCGRGRLVHVCDRARVPASEGVACTGP
mmetsp:Transcript_8926/g.28202  ORF Transcript_8926/g.28202 Transcript_8926/m.28202 type:complete len:251 (-) Transcript_8926:34-786(-)